VTPTIFFARSRAHRTACERVAQGEVADRALRAGVDDGPRHDVADADPRHRQPIDHAQLHDLETVRGALSARAGDLEPVVRKVGDDALVLQSAQRQHAVGAAEDFGEHRQLRRPEDEIADLETADLQHRYLRRAGKTRDAHGRGRLRRLADALCGRGGHRAAVGAGVEHEPERTLAVDQHRCPDAADAVAARRGDELRLGRLYRDFLEPGSAGRIGADAGRLAGVRAGRDRQQRAEHHRVNLTKPAGDFQCHAGRREEGKGNEGTMRSKAAPLAQQSAAAAGTAQDTVSNAEERPPSGTEPAV
jgi:hypothetical protein